MWIIKILYNWKYLPFFWFALYYVQFLNTDLYAFILSNLFHRLVNVLFIFPSAFVWKEFLLFYLNMDILLKLLQVLIVETCVWLFITFVIVFRLVVPLQRHATHSFILLCTLVFRAYYPFWPAWLQNAGNALLEPFCIEGSIFYTTII